MQPAETHQENLSARHDGCDELCCHPLGNDLKRKGANATGMIMKPECSSREPQHAATCTITSGGRFTAFLAFIGVK